MIGVPCIHVSASCVYCFNHTYEYFLQKHRFTPNTHTEWILLINKYCWIGALLIITTSGVQLQLKSIADVKELHCSTVGLAALKEEFYPHANIENKLRVSYTKCYNCGKLNKILLSTKDSRCRLFVLPQLLPRL